MLEKNWQFHPGKKMLSNLLFSCLSYLLSPVFSGLDVSLQFFFFSAAGATSFSLCFSACLNFNPGLGSTCLIFPCFSFHIMSVHQCTEAGWRSQTLDRFRGFFLHWCYREASCCECWRLTFSRLRLNEICEQWAVK